MTEAAPTLSAMLAAILALLPLAALLAWSRWRRDDASSSALDKVADRVSQSAADNVATALAARMRPTGALESFLWLVILAGLGIGGAAKFASSLRENVGPTQPGWPSGGQPTTTPAAQKPNTPAIGVTVVDSSTLYVDFPAFVGSQGDTQDSIAVTVLRLATADTLFHAKSGVQSRDTVSDNTDLSLNDTVRVLGRQKGTNGGWSDADTAQTIITLFAANAPGGSVAIVLDCDFDGTWAGGSGTMNCDTGTLAVTDWNRGGYPADECRIVASSDAPNTSGKAWESHFDDGAGGSGPCMLGDSWSGSRDTTYVAWYTKYQASWQENTNSQKVLHWNTDAGTHADLFQYRYRAEAFDYITSATGCAALEANQASVAVKSPPESSPCQNQRAAYITAGQWDLFEILYIDSSGTVKWWKNGELRGSHSGRDLSKVWGLDFTDTWGGSGTLTQEQSRYYGRIQIRVSTN